jgi:hypothetical protein
MKLPASFTTSSQSELNEKCKSVNVLALHSYETANRVSAAQGSTLLANAISDITRQSKPSGFNALVLYAIENSASKLSTTLAAVNSACPLTGFIKAEKMAASIDSLEQDKFTDNKGQCIEWQVVKDIRSLKPLSQAYVDKSKALLTADGTGLITTIEDALTEVTSLKAERGNRISQTSFNGQVLNLLMKELSASNTAKLASNIKTLGNNEMHWAYVVFVGTETELIAIKELFL